VRLAVRVVDPVGNLRLLNRRVALRL
jgi:hypothetical protein